MLFGLKSSPELKSRIFLEEDGRNEWRETVREALSQIEKRGENEVRYFLTVSPQGAFFPFILPLESFVFPRFFVLLFFSYANKPNKSRGAEPRREVKTGGSIKEILKITKPKVKAGQDGNISLHFFNMWRKSPSFKSNHSSIARPHISLLLPCRFHPSSVTSG